MGNIHVSFTNVVYSPTNITSLFYPVSKFSYFCICDRPTPLAQNNRTQYKLLSLTRSSQPPNQGQPPYLHNLISVQPPGNTRSSYHVTLARPPTSSSLRITDRSFRYASPCLWNQLPSSLRQPHSSPSVSDLPVHAPATSSYSLNSPLSPSISPSVFHSRLKTYLFLKSFPP